MDTSVFINLAVADVGRARSFYTGLGFAVNEQFSDDNAVSIVISETIYVMALKEEFFVSFLSDTVKANAHASTEVLNCLSLASRSELDELLARVGPAGGRIREVAHEDDGMYGASFTDPDGHIWELVHMPKPT